VPYVRRWLSSLPNRPVTFIEPFAGGAVISLTVAFEQLARHVVMVELDEQVASVWQAILGDDGEWLAKRITDFQLTPENIEEVLSAPAGQLRDRAFQTILRNRINRGGILAPGAGKIKYGEAGKGLASRWYPGTLRKRILSISAIRERLTFIHGDGLEVMRQHIQNTQAVFFIDPPYTAGGKRAGRRLYTHSELDHVALFQLAGQLAGDFLMTYDEAPEVRDLAHRFGFDVETVAMKSTHHAKMRELLIGRNLDWLR
jgi:DNA adenine methylase